MPIDSLHPHLNEVKEDIKDCRVAFEGSRQVKYHGVRYLPQLRNQNNDDYAAYKNRALFFSITSKTVSALVGMVMAKEPMVKNASDQMKPYFEDRQGAQFLEICSTTVQEVLLMGGYGILVDAPVEGSQNPEIKRYVRESVINWRVDDSGRPTLIVLKEAVVQQKGNDVYDFEEVVQFRELSLVDNKYTVRLLNQKGEQQGTTIMPTVRGQPMDHIPFYMINPLGVSFDVVKPPMLDIVDLNFSHYRTSADLEHGRHFTGLPTPWVSGVETGVELYVGAATAWILPNAEARAGYLEFTGQGLQSLEKAMVEKQSQMASLSARMIDNSKRGSEAEGTVRLRYMSETAGLITTTRSVEDGLNQVYAEIATIKGEPPPTIEMNKDFMDSKMSAADLTAIVKAYIEGTISRETLVYNLRKGEVISPKRTDEDEISEIERREKEERDRVAAEAAKAAAQRRPGAP
jgi:hypothetical protein